MADFLRFKGARSVTKQTGDEMVLRQPPNGGSTFQTKRWWGGKGTVVYVSAAIFKVTSSIGELNLVIPTDNETTATNIRHDGDGNFTFSDFRAIDRIAVYNADRSQLMIEYQFPSISGGTVLKRTINALPEAVTFTGDTIVAGTYQEGETLTATPAPFSGGVGTTSSAIRWQTRAQGGGNSWTNKQTQNSGPFTITLAAEDVGREIRAQTRVTDDNGTTVKNSAPPQLVNAAPVPEESYDDLVARADLTVAVTVQDVGGSNKYFIDGVQQDGIVATIGSVVIFDQSDASNATHPLRLYTDASKTTEVTVGVTLKPGGGGLAFEPVIAGSFSYQCQAHANMGGDLTVNA